MPLPSSFPSPVLQVDDILGDQPEVKEKVFTVLKQYAAERKVEYLAYALCMVLTQESHQHLIDNIRYGVSPTSTLLCWGIHPPSGDERAGLSSAGMAQEVPTGKMPAQPDPLSMGQPSRAWWCLSTASLCGCHAWCGMGGHAAAQWPALHQPPAVPIPAVVTSPMEPPPPRAAQDVGPVSGRRFEGRWD